MEEELLNNQEPEMVEDNVTPEAPGETGDPSGMIVDEGAEAAMLAPEEGQGTDDSGILEYFPNVQVTEENREELTAAVNSIKELQETLPILDKYRQVNEELKILFSSEPGLGMAILEFRDGADFATALARHIDLENIAPMEGEPNKEAWDNARMERKSKYEAKQKGEREQEDNIQASIEALQQFQQEKGMADEDAQGFINYLMDMLGAAYSGRLTLDFINRMFMAMNYDSDLDKTKKEALEEGEVRGRNMKINQMKEKQASKPGTGLPDINEGAQQMAKKPKGFGENFIDEIL
jgi:hypothetical protein